MSDDKLKVLDNHPFHPTDPPHGMPNFDLGTLSKDQQRMLNTMKTRRRIENETYLKAHPEVGGLITILLRHLLSNKPEQNVHEIVGEFFNRPRRDIIAQLLDYYNDINYSDCAVEILRKEIAETASVSLEYDRSSASISSSKSTM